MTDTAAAFLAGAAAATVAVTPAAVACVLVVSWLCRRDARTQRECDQWRSAAANASTAARVLEAKLGGEIDDDEDDGDDWKAGG